MYKSTRPRILLLHGEASVLRRDGPTLRNSYITITSCTYHKIRSRASDLSRHQFASRSSLLPDRHGQCDVDQVLNCTCQTVGTEAEEVVDDDAPKATLRLDDSQLIYTKEEFVPFSSKVVLRWA